MSFPFRVQPMLHELDQTQWEQLCDGCGKCCLQKLEDDEDGTVYYTNLVCQYMSSDCSCSVYQQRHELVPNCVWLQQQDVEAFYWLPSTCSYRMVHEQRPLPLWHHLNTGDRQSIHQHAASVLAHKLLPDNQVDERDWEEHIINWVD